MKITIKTLQQKVFTVEAEPSETVGDLKQKVQELHGHSIASQKLIYSGKVLPDAKTVESCEIKEKDFLVLMVSKPKAAPAPAPSTSAPVAQAQTPAAAAAPAAPVAAPATTTAPVAAPVAAPPTTNESSTPVPFDSTSSFLSGAALQSTIANIQEMGFERDQIMRALRASFNNPERAVEYLMTGIPEGLEGVAAGNSHAPGLVNSPPPHAAPAAPANVNTPPTAAPAAAPPASNAPQNLFALAQAAQGQQQGGATSGLPTGGGGGAGAPSAADIAALASSPQMAQIRQLMRQNPSLLQPMLQQLMASNPAMAQRFQQNPEALMQLLGLEEDDEMGEGEGGAGGVQIQVTEEEQASIHRLEALGFPRHAVIQAYFACDKNEELAANFLFESGGFED